MPMMRRIVLLSVLALIGVGAFGAASIDAARERDDLAGGGVWSSHPDRLIGHAMAEIGAAARLGKPIAPSARALLMRAARAAPLAPQPFLAEGAIAQTEGHEDKAAALFDAALTRDPRNGAAQYFLANHYLETGRLDEGLAAMDALARIVSGAGQQFVPALTAFAKQPAAVPALRRFLIRSPRYSAPVLEALAADVANAELVVALAPPRAAGVAAPGWQTVLVSKMIEAGQGARAKSVWRGFAGVARYDGIFNPTFAPNAAPPPFNWSYDASGAGLVAPRPGGGLDVLYYGRQDAVLAVQTLQLGAGSYRFSSDVSGPGGGVLNWKINCQRDDRELLTVEAGRGAGFTVPAGGCDSQKLHLAGTPGDSQQQVELRIGAVHLQRGSGQ